MHQCPESSCWPLWVWSFLCFCLFWSWVCSESSPRTAINGLACMTDWLSALPVLSSAVVFLFPVDLLIPFWPSQIPTCVSSQVPLALVWVSCPLVVSWLVLAPKWSFLYFADSSSADLPFVWHHFSVSQVKFWLVLVAILFNRFLAWVWSTLAGVPWESSCEFISGAPCLLEIA